MQEFTKKDCVGIGEEVSLKSRVVVLAPRALPGNHPGQLFFCTGVQGTENPRHSIAQLVSLSTGEVWKCWHRDVIGILKPELLGETARLQLSRSVLLVQRIFGNIHRNIPVTVFCRMAGMRQACGWQIRRRHGSM